MAKERKNSLYNVDKEKKTNKKIKKNKAKKKDDDKFSFDNEIIIGVTKIEEKPIKEKKKKSKKISKNKTKNIEKKEKENKKKVNKKKKDKKVKTKKVHKVNPLDEIINEEQLNQRREERKRRFKRKLRIVKYITLVALIIVVILLILFSPLFNIKEILVEDNEIVSTEQIKSLAKINIDTNTFKINANKVNKQVKENPYIDEIEIIRNLPSTIIIKVKERKPAFLIEYANGYACIDKSGYILNIAEEKQNLPILQGLQTTNDKFVVGSRLEVQDLSKVYVVSKILEIAAENDISSLITRVDIENINNIKLILEEQEKTVYVGDYTNLNIKLLTLKQILEKTEGTPGEILINMNLNSEYPIFREKV